MLSTQHFKDRGQYKSIISGKKIILTVMKLLHDILWKIITIWWYYAERINIKIAALSYRTNKLTFLQRN
jgi:hypothetical protein